jgi:hypothetical protein
MLRALSIFGLGGGFLIISPKLRFTVETSLDAGIDAMSVYAPWSYCGAVALALVMVAVTLFRGAQPR